MKEETMFKIVNEINDALRDLKYNQCNVDTKEKGWETYYGLDDELIKYIRKIEKQLDQYENDWEELKKWVKDISYIEGNDDFCNGFNRAICGMREDILNKMKELEEGK
jgi:hypothetical protein